MSESAKRPEFSHGNPKDHGKLTPEEAERISSADLPSGDSEPGGPLMSPEEAREYARPTRERIGRRDEEPTAESDAESEEEPDKQAS